MPQTLVGCPECRALLGQVHLVGCSHGAGKPVTSIGPGPFELLADLRASGWRVASHNDYGYKGRVFTFWLMTHHTGVFVKGEGETDLEALSEIIADIKRRDLIWIPLKT